jgi:hypothetical protein
MANDLLALRETAFYAYHEKIANAAQDWQAAVEVIRGSETTLSVGAQMSAGIFGPASATADLSADDISSTSVTIGSEFFEKKVRCRWQDVQSNPDVIVKAAASLAGAAVASVDKIVTTGFQSAFSIAHPSQGLVNPAAGPVIPFIGTDLAIGGVGGVGSQQSNLVGAPGTAALSQGTLHTAIAKLSAWKSHEGIALNMVGPYCLVYGPENSQIAYSLMNSAVMSADQQASQLNVLPIVGCMLPEMGNDWILVDQTSKPFILRYIVDPTVEVARTSDGIWTEVIARFGAKFAYRPTEAGCAGSNPP